MLANSPTNTFSKVPQSMNQGPSSTSPSSETSSIETSDELRREIPQEFLNTAEINQPVNFKFPYRLFGKQRRSFRAPWFKQYKWLHYCESTDSVLCHICMTKATSVGCQKANDACSIKGFSNWKNALANFATQDASNHHKTAMLEKLAPNQHRDLGETFYEVDAESKFQNR